MKLESTGTLFRAEMMRPISNTSRWFNKPRGGYWTTPLSNSSWRNYCREEGYAEDLLDVRTLLSTVENSRIAVIKNLSQYLRLFESFPLLEEGLTRMPDAASMCDAIKMGYLSMEDLDNPQKVVDKIVSGKVPRIKALDYEALFEYYDALLVEAAATKDADLAWYLHAWDCDTLLIGTPTVISEKRFFIRDIEINELTARRLAPIILDLKEDYLDEEQDGVRSTRFRRGIDSILESLTYLSSLSEGIKEYNANYQHTKEKK